MTYQSGRSGRPGSGCCQASICCSHSAWRDSPSAAISNAWPPSRPKNRVYRRYHSRPHPNRITGKSHAIANRAARVSPGALQGHRHRAAGLLARRGGPSGRPQPSSAPSAAKSAHSSPPLTASNRARAVTRAPSCAAATIANWPGSARPDRVHRARPRRVRPHRCRRRRRPPASPRRSSSRACQLSIRPTRSARSVGFSTAIRTSRAGSSSPGSHVAAPGAAGARVARSAARPSRTRVHARGNNAR